MPSFTLLNSLLPLALSLATASVSAQTTLAGTTDPTVKFPATALADKRFSYPSGIPYQADADSLERGTQYGVNYCDGLDGQDSKCQTSFLNSLDDFCLWSPPEPDSVIGDTEGETVAWCTKPGRGTRVIPEGALTGVQFMKTPEYIQVVGFIDQKQINIQTDDYGGEMDPHGADLRGNPLGGLVYSNNFGGNNESFDQVIEWHNFMGGNAFCFKVCDPNGSRAAELCQHIYDRIGCAYNAPNEAKDGVFEVCEGEAQDPPGVYTAEDGAVSTYTQPEEGVVPTPEETFTPRMPASSNCVTFTSSELYNGQPTATAAAGSGAASSAEASASGSAAESGSAAASGSSKPAGSASRSSSGAGATGTTGASNASAEEGGDGALGMAVMWALSALCIGATSVLLA